MVAIGTLTKDKKNIKMKLGYLTLPTSKSILIFFPRKDFWITFLKSGYYAVNFSTSSKFFVPKNYLNSLFESIFVIGFGLLTLVPHKINLIFRDKDLSLMLVFSCV